MVIFTSLKRFPATPHPLIIIPNGRPARAQLLYEESDKLMSRKQFIESVEQGLMVAEFGAVYGTDELSAKLAEKRATRKT